MNTYQVIILIVVYAVVIAWLAYDLYVRFERTEVRRAIHAEAAAKELTAMAKMPALQAELEEQIRALDILQAKYVRALRAHRGQAAEGLLRTEATRHMRHGGDAPNADHTHKVNGDIEWGEIVEGLIGKDTLG